MEHQKVKCEFCRGIRRVCPFSLVEGSIKNNIKQIVEKTEFDKITHKQDNCKPPHHPRLRIAVAACPNACTKPQITDVGIIANITPNGVGPNCDGCGECTNICRERAIRIHNGRAQLAPKKCVGCGQCIKGCPHGAIKPKKMRFRILVGGRMGRHPKWAKQLCIVDSDLAAEKLAGFVDIVTRLSVSGERIAAMVERVGVATMRNGNIPNA